MEKRDKRLQLGKKFNLYDSGKIKREFNNVDGEPPGKYIEYYESGKVQWEVNFVRY